MSASAALARATEQAGVEIRALHDLSELDDARWIFDAVWPTTGSQVQPNLLIALLHAGGYCSAAYLDGRPVGAALGFVGRHREATWREHLHSHMAAVLEPYRDRRIGTALKLHQRVWAQEQGIPVITWTFDPLVRRNARLNLLNLGVLVRGYSVNFYGEMQDTLNAGDPSDRVFAWWEVDSERADAAARGELAPISDAAIAQHPEWIIVALPEDIIAIREADPALASAWRLRVRDELIRSFDAGYEVLGVTDEGGYVLGRHA